MVAPFSYSGNPLGAQAAYQRWLATQSGGNRSGTTTTSGGGGGGTPPTTPVPPPVAPPASLNLEGATLVAVGTGPNLRYYAEWLVYGVAVRHEIGDTTALDALGSPPWPAMVT